jgi:hypothetical protein
MFYLGLVPTVMSIFSLGCPRLCTCLSTADIPTELSAATSVSAACFALGDASGWKYTRIPAMPPNCIPAFLGWSIFQPAAIRTPANLFAVAMGSRSSQYYSQSKRASLPRPEFSDAPARVAAKSSPQEPPPSKASVEAAIPTSLLLGATPTYAKLNPKMINVRGFDW